MALPVAEEGSKLRAKIFDCEEDFFVKYKMAKESVLGRGLSGEVILARFQDDPENKRAVKVFPKGDKNAVLFVTETAVLQKISHPNVLGDVMPFKCPDNFVLCMPYYPAGSLRRHLSQMTHHRILKYFLQLTSAILYLHAHHIAHRDVKPDNILLDEDDDIVLIDFGLACRVTSPLTQTGTAGTKGYTPPEVFTGQPVDLLKCDLYALGVVLWNMVFKGQADPSTNYLHYVEQNKKLPLVFRTLLHHLLDPDPKTRWDDQQLAGVVYMFPELTNMANLLWGQ